MMNIHEKLCFLALRFPSDSCHIKNVMIGKEGRVKFRVPINVFVKSDPEAKKMFSTVNFESLETFYVDVAGSIIVRKNIQTFEKLLENMDFQGYNEKILSYNHLHFSLERNSNCLEWTFQISFLHDLVLDSFLSCPGEENV